jgi:hypothetical protein
MKAHAGRGMPRWLFAVVAAGALLASGLYIGMIRMQGPTAPHLARVIGFGVLGIIMLYGATAKQ